MGILIQADAFQRQGLSFSHSGQWDQAVVAYTKAIELQPQSAESHNSLAWLLATCPEARLRDPQRALELARKATELAPNDWMYWNTLGVAQYRAGDWTAAIAGLTKSMELRNGGDSFDWFVLAMAHWQLKKKDEAHKWHNQAVEWMEKNEPEDEELKRFRAEATELLEIKTNES